MTPFRLFPTVDGAVAALAPHLTRRALDAAKWRAGWEYRALGRSRPDHRPGNRAITRERAGRQPSQSRTNFSPAVRWAVSR